MLTSCPTCNNTEIHYITTMGWMCNCCGTPFNVTKKVGPCSEELLPGMMRITDKETGESAATLKSYTQATNIILNWWGGGPCNSCVEITSRFMVKGLCSTDVMQMVCDKLGVSYSL